MDLIPQLVVAITQQVMSRGVEQGDYLDRAWLRLRALRGALVLPLPNNIGTALAIVKTIDPDVVVFTGGADLGGAVVGSSLAPTSPRDAVELALIRELPEVAMVGVCRGAQLLAVDAGSKLVDSATAHAGVEHKIRIRGDAPIVSGLPTCVVVASHHKWAIDSSTLGPNLRAIAWAPDGSVEAFVHHSLPRLGLMWHPERPQQSSIGDMLISRLIQRRLATVMNR